MSRTWVVEVNETAIYIGGTAAEWWAVWRHMCLELADRITIVECGPMGDVVHVACANREHARWVRDLFIARGAMKKAAKVRSFNPGQRPTPVITEASLRANREALDTRDPLIETEKGT